MCTVSLHNVTDLNTYFLNNSFDNMAEPEGHYAMLK